MKQKSLIENHNIEKSFIMNCLPIPELNERQITSFLKKVDIKNETECWTWLANTARTKKGYGEFSINSTQYRAHRVSHFIHYGYMPVELEIDHLCSNTSCVNPNHLEPVTGKENNRRKTERRRAIKEEQMAGN